MQNSDAYSATAVPQPLQNLAMGRSGLPHSSQKAGLGSAVGLGAGAFAGAAAVAAAE